jgi:hypothetical protein
MGAGPTAAALVEQNNTIYRRVEIPSHRRAATAARTPVQHQNGHPLGVAALFDIDAVSVAHIDHPLIEGIDRRVKKFDCALLA